MRKICILPQQSFSRCLVHLKAGRQVIVNALFPLKCIRCATFYRSNQEQIKAHQTPSDLQVLGSPSTIIKVFNHCMAPFLCTACRGTFFPLKAPLCSTCGMPHPSREADDHVCGTCLRSPPPFKRARAVGVYQHALKEVIHQLKYKGKNQLAKGLGRILFFDYQRLWARNEVDLVLPIPLHPRRQRQRGFNQAYLLVKEWPTLAQRFTPCASTVFVEHRLLHRKRWTDPQVGLDHLKRLQNVRGAFEIKSHNHFIKGKKVLLVDDVYTTGATVSECAKLLMRKGAARVDVLTLAKAVQ